MNKIVFFYELFSCLSSFHANTNNSIYIRGNSLIANSESIQPEHCPKCNVITAEKKILNYEQFLPENI